MEMEDKKQFISETLMSFVHHRFSYAELKDELNECLGVDIGELSDHYIDGKTFLNNTICDDFYSIDVEFEKGKDVYALIYFLPTNEEDIIFVTEVCIEFNIWK